MRLVPKTIEGDIDALLSPIVLRRGHLLDASGPEWTQLWDMCERLQAANVVTASERKSKLWHLAGDLAKAQYWADNAAKNGDRVTGLQCSAIAHVNLGYFSKAGEQFIELTAIEHGLINDVMELGLACGAMSGVVRAAERLRTAGGRVANEELVMIAQASTNALQALGVPEDHLQAMMDQAGHVMRSRKLLWLNENPDVEAGTAEGTPFVAVNYRLDVSPAQAAAMTWELAGRLAELDLMPASVTVAFIGERLPV